LYILKYYSGLILMFAQEFWSWNCGCTSKSWL